MAKVRDAFPSPLQPAEKPYQVLFIATNIDDVRQIYPLAEILTRESEGQLTILNVISLPEGQSVSDSTTQAIAFREALSQLLSEQSKGATHIKTIVRTPQEVPDAIWEVLTDWKIDLLVLPWIVETEVEAVLYALLSAPPCDVVAIRPAGGSSDFDWEGVEQILMPVRGGAHSALTLSIGHILAKHINAKISLLHVYGQGSKSEEAEFIEEFSPALHNLEHVGRSVTIKGNIPEGIVEEVRDHQVIVMGAPEQLNIPNQWTGPLIEALIAFTDIPLMVVKGHQVLLPGPGETSKTSEVQRPVTVVVDNWFAENTFHSQEFSDLNRLISLKEAQGLTISLGLPALNEGETVGEVIREVKSALMDKFPLLDEIVLIDSGSEDRTREIAEDLGIPVYIHQEILPDYGEYRGKGEALWKSLYVLKGDIVAWIDTDIKNIDARFVYGVVGPLLRNPYIQYVKGFYRRPLRVGDKLVAGGGGRVTELTVRPFFNLFFPELSGLIQPLAGEYAGRRSALERLPFFTGYGVETGLLIDLLETSGLNAIAQVDLLERIHHNQPLPSLSKMSFAIMQVVFRRLERQHRTRLLENTNLTMNLIRYGKRRRYYLEAVEISETERPPMITLPEYRRKRGLPPRDTLLERRSPYQNDLTAP